MFCAVCGVALTDPAQLDSELQTRSATQPNLVLAKIRTWADAVRTLSLPKKVVGGVLISCVLVVSLFVVLPRDGALANNACGEVVISKTKSPATSKIVESESFGPVLWENDELAGYPDDTLNVITNYVETIDEALEVATWIIDELKPVKNSNAPGYFLVLGAIDGTNGFGATVRNHWICITQVDGANVISTPNVKFFTN